MINQEEGFLKYEKPGINRNNLYKGLNFPKEINKLAIAATRKYKFF